MLMASGLELPGNVRCIIADCPFSTPEAIIRKACVDMGLPQRFVYPFISLGARIFGGFDLTEGNTSEAVKRAKLPILIIHGEEDRFVPCEMSREICASNPQVELVTFPKAGHGLSFVTDRLRYEAVIRDFLGRHMS